MPGGNKDLLTGALTNRSQHNASDQGGSDLPKDIRRAILSAACKHNKIKGNTETKVLTFLATTMKDYVEKVKKAQSDKKSKGNKRKAKDKLLEEDDLIPQTCARWASVLQRVC